MKVEDPVIFKQLGGFATVHYASLCLTDLLEHET